MIDNILSGKFDQEIYKKLILEHHPDHGGDRSIYQRIVKWKQGSNKIIIDQYNCEHLFTGHISNIYYDHDKDLFIKVSKHSTVNHLIDHEYKLLRLFNTFDNNFNRYFVRPVRCFTVFGDSKLLSTTNIALKCQNFQLILGKLVKNVKKLEDHHTAWIYKRILAILGKLHMEGYSHNSCLPEHFAVRKEDHGMYVFGLAHCAKLDAKFCPTKTYPSLNIFGKDCPKNRIKMDIWQASEALLPLVNPGPFHRFISNIKGCSNALDLFEEFDVFASKICEKRFYSFDY